MEARQRFNGFWNGFEDNGGAGPTPLNKTPSSVDSVTLAFSSSTLENTLNTSYLCKYHDINTIRDWAKELQSNGQNILVSLLDTPSVHWADIDISTFVRNATDLVIGEWGWDGFDIDIESGNASDQNFIDLINEFRAAVDKYGPGRIVTCDPWVGDTAKILKSTSDSLNWVNTMLYDGDYESIIEMVCGYAEYVGADKVNVGVQPGAENIHSPFTPLPEVIQLSQYPAKHGIMLYSLTLDVPMYTGQPVWTWTETIAGNLPKL